jgi:hypothetical protein
VIHPPLEGFPGETEEADCLRINQWVEGSVRECPSNTCGPIAASRAGRRASPSCTKNAVDKTDLSQHGVLR